MRKSIFFLFNFFLIVLPTIVHAQKTVADKIIAQVGDQIVLKSEIDGDIVDQKKEATRPGAPQLPPNLECWTIGNHLMQKTLMIQAVNVDSLPVSDDELESQLEQNVRMGIMYQAGGSRDQFEAMVGKSVFQFKEDMRPRYKEQYLANQEKGKIVNNVKITPEEVEAYYNSIPKDSLPYYESELEINQIVMHPQASKDVKEIVGARLLGFKKDVESGKYKFQDLARSYSEDEGTKKDGGQFSLNRTEKTVVPAFASAAFKLKEGQISPIVETVYGLHLIQMVSKVGDDAVVRHILLSVPVSDIEIKQAVDSLDTVRSYLLKDYLTFKKAVSIFSDDKEGKNTGGAIMNPEDGSSHLAYDQITDKSLLKVLDTLKVGEISLPMVYRDESRTEFYGKTAVRIIYLRSKSAAHRENLADDFDKVSARALAIKKQKVLNEWFHDHIKNFYIRLDDDINQCSNLQDWVETSNKLKNER